MTAAGFRAKTGRAILVVLRGDHDFVCRREISLVDAKVPESAEPHHAVMHLPWPQAMIAVRPFEAAIERVAGRVIAELIEEFAIERVGVAGSPDRDLSKLGNEHIRAHAAEGVLFRRVLEVAARNAGLRCVSLSDRNLTMPADVLKEIGRQAGRPWRVDDRIAATAALRAMA